MLCHAFILCWSKLGVFFTQKLCHKMNEGKQDKDAGGWENHLTSWEYEKAGKRQDSFPELKKRFFFKVSFLSAFQQNGDQFIRGSKGSLGNVCVYLTLKYPSEIQLVFLTVKYVLISLCYSEKVWLFPSHVIISSHPEEIQAEEGWLIQHRKDSALFFIFSLWGLEK